MVLTTAQFHLIKPGLSFCIDSNPTSVMSEIHNGENIWQWSLTLKPPFWINHFANKNKKQTKKINHHYQTLTCSTFAFSSKKHFWFSILYKITGELFTANLISYFIFFLLIIFFSFLISYFISYFLCWFFRTKILFMHMRQSIKIDIMYNVHAQCLQ